MVLTGGKRGLKNHGGRVERKGTTHRDDLGKRDRGSPGHPTVTGWGSTFPSRRVGLDPLLVEGPETPGTG